MKQRVRLRDIHTNNYDHIESLLKNNADPNEAIENSDSPLKYATVYNKLGIAKLLLSYGANPNISSNKDNIPLHYAAWYSPKLIPLLITHGTRIDVFNKDNATPLADAIRISNEKSVHLLLDAGAKMSNVRLQSCIPDWVHEIVAKQSKVKHAIITFFALNKRTKKVHKDLVGVIGNMIWATRRDDVWRK